MRSIADFKIFWIFFSLLFSLFIDEKKVTENVRDHLTSKDTQHNVDILPYDSVVGRLDQYRQKYADGKIWLSGDGTSLALVNRVPEDRWYDKASPVLTSKALKNPVELEGMKNSHVSQKVFW